MSLSRRCLSLHLILATALACCASTATASDFPRLDQALPSGANIDAIHPVFDFDGDGCLPSAGISRYGEQNGGLATSGSITGGCRRSDFMAYSNTLHRYACIDSGGSRYCGHFFALYMLKDQVTALGGGHRHDWEHAAVWTRNGVVTHAGYSAHGKLYNAAASSLPMQNGHVKIVYHKDGVGTHALRFASANEVAENPYGQFVLPVLTSWHTLRGASLDNAAMRSRLNSYNYGSATIPMKDSNFLGNLNTYRPSGYPAFTQASIDASR
ncbi:MAG TPA: NPP1 family protein [Xanthomonadaceae bacterium]